MRIIQLKSIIQRREDMTIHFWIKQYKKLHVTDFADLNVSLCSVTVGVQNIMTTDIIYVHMLHCMIKPRLDLETTH